MKTKPYIFGWDVEPAHERASEFPQSTFSASSVVHGSPRRRPRAPFRWTSVTFAFLVCIGFGTYAIHELARLLRG